MNTPILRIRRALNLGPKQSICPACARGDHDTGLVTIELYRCDCPCHKDKGEQTG